MTTPPLRPSPVHCLSHTPTIRPRFCPAHHAHPLSQTSLLAPYSPPSLLAPSPPSTMKLLYFSARGRVEPTRLALHADGVPFMKGPARKKPGWVFCLRISGNPGSQ